jgi:FtsZ-binding cell division protein ZapB
MVTLQQTIKTNKVEIKEIRDEKKNWTLTKSEAKDQIETIKSENSATKKANRLLTKPVRKINKLSNR